jgi:hypothetical protein
MCELSITGVAGINVPPDEHPIRIEVTGTVTDCATVQVTINDAGPVSVDVPGGNGAWTAIFTEGVDYPVQGFRCGEALKVHASCSEGDCPVAEWNGALVCRPEDEPCPSVTLEVTDVATECGPDGAYAVTLKATVTGAPPDTVYEWDFGNGEDEAALLTSPTLVRTVPYAPGGPYTTTFGFILPQGCASASLALGPFEPCPPECPTATVEVLDVADECADGARTVTLRFTVTGGNETTVAHLDFGDGTNGPPVLAAPGETVASDDYLDDPITHAYDAPAEGLPPATYTPQVVFSPPFEDCPPVPLAPPLSIDPCAPECGRYRVERLRVEAGACEGESRPVTVTAAVSGDDAPASFRWEFSDGAEETTTEDHVTHTMDAAETTEASVAVLATWPNGCTDLATEAFTLEACAPECPEITDVTVTEGECAEGSEERAVTLTAVVNGAAVGPFSWDFGDGETATSDGPVAPPHQYAGGTYFVSVSVGGPEGCERSRFEREITVTDCPDDTGGDGDGDGDGGDGPPPPGPMPPWCEFLRILGLILLIVGLVLIFGGACSSNVLVAVIGGGLAVAGAALLVAWALMCAGFAGGCRLLQRLIELLSFFEILLTILAVIFGILSIFEIGLPCLIGTLIDWGIVGSLIAVLTLIFAQLRCRFRPPTLLDGLLNMIGLGG